MDELSDACIAQNVSPRSVVRVKKLLGIKSIKIQNRWYCEMPEASGGV
jgi:hypothetical protein